MKGKNFFSEKNIFYSEKFINIFQKLYTVRVRTNLDRTRIRTGTEQEQEQEHNLFMNI